MSTLLECKDLTKKYGHKTAIDHISLAIESGHIIGLLGPNGSGKTTLIKMINGLLTPTSGTLYLHEQPIGVESKKHISYLPDHTYLNMNQRVSEVIAFFKDFYEDFDEQRAYDMLEKLHIDPRDRLKSMSKGTKEKVQSHPGHEPARRSLYSRRTDRRRRPRRQRLHFKCHSLQLRAGGFNPHIDPSDRRYREYFGRSYFYSERTGTPHFLCG